MFLRIGKNSCDFSCGRFVIISECNSLYKQNVFKLINKKDDKDNFINQKILVICTQTIEVRIDDESYKGKEGKIIKQYHMF